MRAAARPFAIVASWARSAGLIAALASTSTSLAQTTTGPFTVETSAAECSACHREPFTEWSTGTASHATTDPMAVESGGTVRASVHTLAYQDAVFRDEAAAMGDPYVCERCHVPSSAFYASQTRGVYAPSSRRPDAPNAMEGVTCVSCHVDTAGAIRIPAITPAAGAEAPPHPLVADPWMGTSAFCGTCHQDTVWGSLTSTFQEWQQGAFAARTCQSCHMMGQEHVWPGGHSSKGRKSGLALVVPTTASSGSVLAVSVRNLHAGHNVPTGDTFRAFQLRVSVKDSAGKEVVNKAVAVAPAIQTPFFVGEEVRPRMDPVPASGARPLELGVLPAGTYTVTTTLTYQITREVVLKYPQKSVTVTPTPELAVGTWSDRLSVCAPGAPCTPATVLHDPGTGF